MHGIYLIADFSFPAARSPKLLERLLIPGIALLQYRDKHADAAQRGQCAAALKTLCTKKRVPLIINDDGQLALTSGADGVHLGRNDTSPADARVLLGDDKIIGVSCYQSLERARAAQNDGADYVAFGALFPSPTKPDARRITLRDFSAYKKQLNVPVCAIGGIDDANIRQVFSAGADLAAMISHVWQSPDPEKALAACVAAMKMED